MTDQELYEQAKAAAADAYAPYSKFLVGAAALLRDGRVITGVNVENASYGTAICAERVALFTAVSEGERDFIRLAVVSGGAAPFPCGACRQVLAEFAPELTVLVRGAGAVAVRRLSDLLPEPFRLSSGDSPQKPRAS